MSETSAELAFEDGWMGVLLIARNFAPETDRQDHRSSARGCHFYVFPLLQAITPCSNIKRISRTLHGIDSSNIMTTSLFSDGEIASG